MTSGLWNRAVSVLLTPSGDQGDDLLDLARQWTREGLLAPALWVRPEAVTVEDGVPPTIGAIVMARGDEGEIIEEIVDLFEVLANESLRLVRLVKVRSTIIDRQSDATQDDVADVVSTYLSYSMPLLNPALSGSTERTELIRISLICAPTDFQMSQRVESAMDDTSVLVLASPEDRATPTAGDAFVRVNERFTGFVLMHLATLAGIWAGLPIGTLELFEREGSAAQAIWIPRVFVSGVLTGGLARRVAARTLEELGLDSGVTGSGAQITATGTFVIPPESVGDYVDEMVAAAMRLGDGALGYVAPQVEAAPTTRKLSNWDGFVYFLSFSADKIAQIPRWIRLWGHDRLARGMNRRLHGKDGYRAAEMQLDQQLDARDQLLVSSAMRVHADDEAARAAESAPRLAVGRSSARLWTGMRQLTFRTLDGSGGDSVAAFPAVDGATPVFSRLSDVLPDPRQAWEHPAPRPAAFPASVTWRMVRDQPELRLSLESSVAAARTAQIEAQTQLDETNKALQAIRQELETITEALLSAGKLKLKPDGKYAAVRSVKQAAESEATLNGGELPAVTVDDYRVLETRFDSQESAVAIALSTVAGATDAVERAEVVLGSFDDWLIPRQRTFAWRLLDRMNDAQSNAASDLETAEANAYTAPAPGELVRLRRRFHRGVLICSLIVGIVTLLALGVPPLLRALLDSGVAGGARALVEWVATFFLSEDYPDWWWLLLGGVGALALTLPLFLAAYYLGWSQFERQVQLAEFGLFAAAGRIRALRAEVNRLRSVHRVTVDWLDMMSAALHDPWRVRPEWLETTSPTLDSWRLPYAMHVAQAADVPGPSSDGMKLAAAQELVKTGWRARAFSDMIDETRIRLGLDPTRLNLDALDNDAPEASNYARRRLRTGMADDNVLHKVAERRLADVVSRLREAALYTDGAEVEPIRADPLAAFRSSGERRTTGWLEFLQQTLGTGTDVPTPLSPLVIAPHQVQQAHHQKVSSFVLAPDRIASDLSRSASGSMTVKAYEPSASDAFDAVVRVDMIGPIPAAAVHLWSDQKRVPDTVVRPTEVSVCSQCGRWDCPAAGPESSLECAYSGV
jgi:hypothetical protein